jgi:hypothetical protein
MKFSDFKDNPQDLVGKTVLYRSGQSYSERSISLSLRKIERVTKTGFAITHPATVLFSLIDGHQKGLNGRMDMGTISQCELLTDDEANEYRRKWKRQKEEKMLREEMLAKFNTLTYDQLLKFKELI